MKHTECFLESISFRMPLQNLSDTDSGCFFVWWAERGEEEGEERRREGEREEEGEREGGEKDKGGGKGGKEGEGWDMKSVITKHILCILARW